MTEWETRQGELEHYGRLGMKWYQHRFGEEDGRAKYTEKIQKKEAEETYKKYSKPLRKEKAAAEKAERKMRPDKVKEHKEKQSVLTSMLDKELEDIYNSPAEQFFAIQSEARKESAKRFLSGFLLGAAGAGIKAGIDAKYKRPETTKEYKTYAHTGRTIKNVQRYGPDDSYVIEKKKKEVKHSMDDILGTHWNDNLQHSVFVDTSKRNAIYAGGEGYLEHRAVREDRGDGNVIKRNKVYTFNLTHICDSQSEAEAAIRREAQGTFKAHLDAGQVNGFCRYWTAPAGTPNRGQVRMGVEFRMKQGSSQMQQMARKVYTE